MEDAPFRPAPTPSMRYLTQAEERDFRIRFDIICKHDIYRTARWNEHSAVLKMVEIVANKEGLKTIEELWEELLSNNPLVEADETRYRQYLKDLKDAEDVELRRYMRQVLQENWFIEGGDHPYNFVYILPGQYNGVSLGRSIELKWPNDGHYFIVLFAFRFSHTHYRIEFLEHHFKKTFRSQIKQYKLFLKEVCEHLEDSLKSYIQDYASHRRPATPGKQTSKRKLNSFVQNTKELKTVLAKHLFDISGNIIGRSKPNKIKEIGWAMQKFLGDDYRPTDVARFLTEEFGAKLGNEKETLRDYLKSSVLIENQASKALLGKIQDLSKQ